MKKMTLDLSNTKPFVRNEETGYLKDTVAALHNVIHEKTGAGNDFLGWLDLPKAYDKAEFARIKAAAEKIKADSEVLIVIGIGGSYLGAKAALDFLHSSFYNEKKRFLLFLREISL